MASFPLLLYHHLAVNAIRYLSSCVQSRRISAAVKEAKVQLTEAEGDLASSPRQLLLLRLSSEWHPDCSRASTSNPFMSWLLKALEKNLLDTLGYFFKPCLKCGAQMVSFGEEPHLKGSFEN